MRSFNTTGPVKPDKHYCIPPLARLDLDEVLRLVDGEKYFVLHAPRQTGKTSALLALRDLLDGRGYGCVYTTVETARTAREDVEQGMRTVLAGLGSRVRSTLGDEFPARIRSGVLAEFGPSEALREVLTRWAAASPKPDRPTQEVRSLDQLLELSGGKPVRRKPVSITRGYAHHPRHFSLDDALRRRRMRVRSRHRPHSRPFVRWRRSEPGPDSPPAALDPLSPSTHRRPKPGAQSGPEGHRPMRHPHRRGDLPAFFGVDRAPSHRLARPA